LRAELGRNWQTVRLALGDDQKTDEMNWREHPWRKHGALNALLATVGDKGTEMILHLGVRYEERGPEVSKMSKQKRTQKMIRELRRLGYRIELTTSQPAMSA
jgi:hypothetical protein